MRQHFDTCYMRLMVLEGHKLTNHALDPGGKTKFGISELAYPNETIAGLTLARARELTRRDWWEPLGCDHLNDKEVCFQLLESSFHMDPPRRPRRATRMAQMALLILDVEIEIDGVMGVKTIGELNRCEHPVALVNLMNGLQFANLLIGAKNEAAFIAMVTDRLDVLREFGRGWLRRIEMQG